MKQFITITFLERLKLWIFQILDIY